MLNAQITNPFMFLRKVNTITTIEPRLGNAMFTILLSIKENEIYSERVP